MAKGEPNVVLGVGEAREGDAQLEVVGHGHCSLCLCLRLRLWAHLLVLLDELEGDVARDSLRSEVDQRLGRYTFTHFLLYRRSDSSLGGYRNTRFSLVLFQYFI